MRILALLLWSFVHAEVYHIVSDLPDARGAPLCLQSVTTKSVVMVDLWTCNSFFPPGNITDKRDLWVIDSNPQDSHFSILNERESACLAFDAYEKDPRGASLMVGGVSCDASEARWSVHHDKKQFVNQYTGLCLQVAIASGEKPAAGCAATGDSHSSLGCVHLYVCDDPADNRTFWHLEHNTPAPTPSQPTKQPTSSSPSVPTAQPTTLSPSSAAPTTHAPATRKPTTAKPTLSPTLSPTKLPTLQPTKEPTTPMPTLSPTTPQPTLSPTTPQPTAQPTTAQPTRKPTTGSPTHSPTKPTQQPTNSPTTAQPSTSPPTSRSPTTNPDAPYVNHFSIVDNPYAIPVSGKDGMNVIFVLGDFGSFQLLNNTKCCQNKVAARMIQKRAQLEAQGYNVLFVAALGDNFYWTGVCPEVATPDYGPCYQQWPGLMQWQHWLWVYQNLTNIPWLGVYGNHDYGNSDVYAMCPDKSPRVRINGQAYAANALDVDKGGYRPFPATTNFHIPDFNYFYTIKQLNFEMYVLDQNALYMDHIGGDPTGRTFVNRICGPDPVLQTRLNKLKDAGESMMAYWASQGPAMRNQTRNVLLLQHYPGPCEDLKALFKKSIGPTNYSVDVRCIFGHSHDNLCKDANKPPMSFCQDILLGGGGGCCAGDPVEKGDAGFGVIYLSRSGMKLEMVTDIGPCSVCTAGEKWWTANIGKMREYWEEQDALLNKKESV